jgi:hypothetical protein
MDNVFLFWYVLVNMRAYLFQKFWCPIEFCIFSLVGIITIWNEEERREDEWFPQELDSLYD